MTLPKRYPRTTKGKAADAAVWSEMELEELERAYASGMSVHEIVRAFTDHGGRLTEATFRKYVQLGLLPRSVRVARTGRGKGSQGLYPATAVRQIDHVRRLMAQGFTMEEIQKEFLFVRGDVESLERQLERIFDAMDGALTHGGRVRGGDPLVERQLAEARELGARLVETLEDVERRLTMRARMARAVV